MEKNKVKKQLNPEQAQMLENILSLTQQLKQMEQAEGEGTKAEGAGETKEPDVMDAIIAKVEGLTDEQKAAMKKAYSEAAKANAEEEAGEKKIEDEQPGAKEKAAKAEDNKGTGSSGSDDAEKRVDDNTSITQEAVDELAKNLLATTSIMKSMMAEQSEIRKALEGVMETLGMDRAMKSISPEPEQRKPVQEANNVVKALTDEIRALKEQGGFATDRYQNGSDKREGVRKALRDNLSSLVIR